MTQYYSNFTFLKDLPTVPAGTVFKAYQEFSPYVMRVVWVLFGENASIFPFSNTDYLEYSDVFAEERKSVENLFQYVEEQNKLKTPPPTICCCDNK